MEKTKLNISATLKQAFALYRQNFWALLKFALVGFLCGLPSTVGNYLKGLENDRMFRAAEMFRAPGAWEAMDAMAQSELVDMMTPSRGIAVIGLVLSVLSVVLFLAVRMKNELGAQLYLADAAGGEEEKPTMKRAYAKTKGKMADIFGMYLMLGIIACFCLAPFWILFMSLIEFTEISLNLLKWLTALTMTPVAVLGYPWFFLVPPVAAFEEGEDKKISMLSRMVKGSFPRIAVVSFFGITLSGIFMNLFSVHALAAVVIEAVITLFVFGFGSAAALVAYQTLRPEREERESREQVPAEYYQLPPLPPQISAPQEDIPEETIANEEPAAEKETPQA